MRPLDDAEVEVCFGGWIQNLELRVEILFLGIIYLEITWQVKKYLRWITDLAQCRLTLLNSYEQSNCFRSAQNLNLCHHVTMQKTWMIKTLRSMPEDYFAITFKDKK